MFLTPFSSLTWAYQLHYYFAFRTHRRRPHFAANSDALTNALSEICQRHDYHLLEERIYPDQLRCVLSLRPEQAVAAVVQTIKANSARIGANKPVWARGYLAQSIGRMQIDAVRQYLIAQASHHGYAGRLLPPVFGYRAEAPVPLTTAHSRFELNYHLVFATWERTGVFSSELGKALVTYWLKVAAKRGFAIDQVSVVPDHVHLLVRLVPQLSIEACGLALLNNAQHFIGQRFPEALIQAKVPQLWQPSAYAVACGELTTALIKPWLAQS